MADFITLGFLGYGLITFFRTLGLIAAIVLIVVWWTRVKNTTALFHDKKKIRATLLFFVPGLVLLCLGIYFRFLWTPEYDFDYGSGYSSNSDSTEYVPTLANLYIANYADEMGRIQVGDFKDSLRSKESKELTIPSKKESDTLRLWLGDSLVLDTIISGGTYVGNFSDDVSVAAEEVVYSTYSSASTEDLQYILVTKPGIERFSSSTYEDVYGFNTEAPSTVSVSSSTSRITKWDVSVMTDEELMQMLIDAIGKEGGEAGLEEEESEE